MPSFKYHKHKFIYITALSIALCTMPGCTKLVEVAPPVTSSNADNVYQNDATAISVLTGIYTLMNQSVNTGIASLSVLPGLSADELTLYGGVTDKSLINYYRNQLTNGNADFWNSFYTTIYTTNAAIEGLAKSTGLTSAVKQQLQGEAKFMRAFCYFYLVNLYGDVPLPTTTDFTQNGLLTRTSRDKVYDQVIADLKEAQVLLNKDFPDASLKKPGMDRLRPTRWAATALLSRAYLFTGKWSSAVEAATEVITNDKFHLADELNDVFLANSSEAIWQLQPVNYGENTPDAKYFILPGSGPQSAYPVYLSQELLKKFEEGDARRSKWVDSAIAGGVTYYYPFKYKVNTLNAPVTEYKMVLRLAEQLLIRAEGNAQQGNTAAALADLNLIRQRGGVGAYKGPADKPSLLSAITLERQVELFTEWGDRWLNLKRTATVDNIMTTVTQQKGGTWNTNWQWYPIPLSDIQSNPGIVQNSGY